ncbi:unnamed protein product [Linum trigynum]|uniref:Uncharacterized protein n=1 Tax=Linum trigynum TaxID=586398 RepID=A0AAV2CT25_9ROSI
MCAGHNRLARERDRSLSVRGWYRMRMPTIGSRELQYMLRREAFFTNTRTCCIMSGGECHDPKCRDRVDRLKNAAIWLSCHEKGKGGDISDKALSACASHLAESGSGYERDRCKRRHNWSEAIAVSLMSPRQGETSWHAYAERLVLRNECTSRRRTDFGSLCP